LFASANVVAALPVARHPCEPDVAMTLAKQTNKGDDGVDPWARGGAMASVPDTAVSDVRLSFESARASGQAPRRSSRRAWLLIGGAALIAVIGLFVAFGGDNAPPEPGEAVDVNVERFPEVTEAPPPTAPRATPPPLLADMPPVGSRTLDPTERLVLAAAPREFVVDVSPELAGINPTEVVALQGDEGLYEVSVPSGRVRVTDLGFFTGQTQLVATDQAAVIWPTPEGAAQIVSTQRSVGIVEAQVDRVSWSPGTDRMYLWAGRPFPTGDVPAVLAVDGEAPEIRLSPADWVDDVDDPAVLLDFDGGLLRRDTGGTYNVGPDGAKRLTTGYVIANGPNHLLLRECDAERLCGLVSVGRDGTRFDWPIDIPDGVSQQQLAGLSPGGDALLVIGDRMSADVPGTLQILELTDGAMQPLQASQIFEGFASWDTDGAGIFYADRQLLYFDRFTGESVVVSDDLPRLRAVRTRRPADSPFCEVLEVALPQFDKMTAGGIDNIVRAPAADVLDRVVALAPDSLQVEASAVASFVNEFVSPDVAGSQTVANWPAQVASGLEALDSYAATGCRFTNR
jgi:hypothetical protein